MKKSKVGKQLRKIATRDAIEKRRNSKPVDPFMAILETTKRHNPVVANDYPEYEDEENYYGNT